ncbi:MAG TPA: putative DNA-binding domain-containing protein [Kofleriaceae bacterium]|jgi:hypothetical protein
MSGDRPSRPPPPSIARRRRISTRTEGLANAYRVRVADAIKAGYPALAAAIGDEAFDALVAEYLSEHSAPRLDTRGAGDQLPEHLAASPAHPVWHGELAQLDRAHAWVLDAPDAELLSPDAAFTPSLPLALIPAHALVDLTTSVDESWRTLAGTEAAHDLAAAAAAAATLATLRPRDLDWPRTVLVWRDPSGQDAQRTVPPDEASALRQAAAGARLGDLRFASSPNPTARAFDVVLRWLADGVLAG